MTGRHVGLVGSGLFATVDLREEVFDVEPQTGITKDNAPVFVDMLVFMRVVDPEASVLRVQSYRSARGMAVTTLRAVVGDMALDDVLCLRVEATQMNHPGGE
ncbi:MAG: hypothetical protein GEU75_03995 [Dehalococcoidia bacterium]|nr:hypothetical protein [Dehalococcoidia bacterium]